MTILDKYEAYCCCQGMGMCTRAEALERQKRPCRKEAICHCPMIFSMKQYDEPKDHTDDELEEGRTTPFKEPESSPENEDVF